MSSLPETTSAAGPADGARAPAGDWNSRAVYVLALLTFVATFNYLDRSLLGLALPQIKAEMHVSDTALGLVSGLAFVLFYSVLGVPIAWAADRWSRRNIIAVGLAFWSLMTALTGLAANVWQLALARFLMGAGEACGTPPSASIISDLVPPARRPLAMAIYGSALSIAFIVFFPVLGWVGHTRGWRAMFVVAGAPGLLLAVLFLLTVKEPVRGAAELKPVGTLAPASFVETLRVLLASRAYLALLVTAALMGMNVFAASTWTPTFLARVHGLSMVDVASVVGPVRGFCNLGGMILGGLLMDRLARRGGAGRLTVGAVACFFVAPAEILFLLGGPQWVWVTGYAASAFFSLIHQPAVFATIMAVAPVRMRSVASALLLFSSAMLGQTLGPLAVGALNDALAPEFGPAAIRWSMMILVVTAALAGGVLLLADRLLAKETNARA